MPTGNSALYFDSAATTRVAPEVCAAMLKHLEGTGAFANPSSAQHEAGRLAADGVEQARADVAGELCCATDEILFTSGATESINLALRGVMLANARHGRHLVTTQIEHKAALACCQALADEGFEITRVPPGRDGRVDPAAIADAVRPDTLLVSVMHTNNETGVMQPMQEIAAIAEDRGVLLHVDAAQAAGKLRIDLTQTPIDLLSLSAHKFHGPKGIGCLFVRDRGRLPLRPLTFGGGQEFGLRPGTLPTHQIAGLAAALRLVSEHRDRDHQQVSRLRARFIETLSAQVPLSVHGAADATSPYIVNLSIPGIRSDALINQCASEIAIASGSACSSGTVEPSHVLRAMGVEGDLLYGAVRVSFDRYHTAADIEAAAGAIAQSVKRIRELDA
ncbi:cysteine desulfurase family protein [uncultured Thiohalocapsa sp.]|uniref:cysteine desulfurase family protein n=1 Tax=uncultured Thiohalocapsa sp. TaxID=768990 RepID=UPI0025D361FD|nr:cysteine desulfurase family protein [uncultured Thiohalocapsa sp.]